MIERKYFHINEGMARAAKNANSFSDYVEGSATAEYKSYVDRVYDVVDRIAEEKPNLLERATGKAERYSRKLAEYYNNYYRNKAIRLKDTEKGNEQLRSMGYSDEQIKELREPDFCGRVGYPDYALTNNNANIKRTKSRLESLKKEKSRETSENEVADLPGVTIKENVEEMRLQLFFEGKPEPEVRDILKRQAFKWSPRNGCWQRQLTNNARWAVKQAIEEIKRLQEDSHE